MGWRTGGIVAAALAVVVLVGDGGAGAAQQAPEVVLVWGTTRDSGATVEAGGSIEVTGTGFPAGGRGSIRIGGTTGDEVGTWSAGRDGAVATSVAVPPGYAAGPARLIACAVSSTGACTVGAAASLTVGAPATTTTRATTTTTTLPIGTPTTTTTLPIGTPTTTTTLPLGSATTTTDVSRPGGLSGPSTTLGGDPPAPSTIGPPDLGISTTTTQPPLQADIPEEVPNLAVEAIEVTQGLQDLPNKFPLVAGRLTTVRVHGLTTEEDASQGGITGAIQVVRVAGGKETVLGVQFDENTTPITFHDGLRRLDPATTPYFTLPLQWASGTLKIRAWVYAYDVEAGNEPDQADNLAEVTVSFDNGRPIHLYYWPLSLEVDGVAKTVDPFAEYLPQQFHVYRSLPIPNAIGHPMSAVVGQPGWDLSEGSETMGAPLTALLEMHQLDGRADNDHYVGLVHPDVPSHFGGLAKGRDKPVLWSKWHSGYNGTFPWAHRGGSILAHELGHNMGINHAPCKSTLGDPYPGELAGGAIDLGFPGLYGFPSCSLAPQDSKGYMGWDVAWQLTDMESPPVMSNIPAGDKEPNYAYPFMGYKGPGWVDPWHGCLVLQFVEVACDQLALEVKDLDAPSGQGDPGGIPTPGWPIPNFDCKEFSLDGKGETDLCNLTLVPGGDPTASEPADADGYLLVSGVVNRKTGGGRVEQVLAVPDRTRIAPASAPAGEEVEFVLVYETDRPVAVRAVVIEQGTGGHAAGSDGTEWFAEKAPPIAGLTRVTLVSKSAVLGTLTPKGGPPSGGIGAVSVTGGLDVPLRLADPDGDPVLGYLQYRPRPDAAWTTVAARVTGDVATNGLQSLPAGDRGQLRLLATDGWSTTQAVAEGVVIPEKGPTVGVLGPVEGDVRPAGHPLVLTGQAVDAEDGVLDGRSVVWTSDRDGGIGSGAAMTVSDLSVGDHVLTMTATDTKGNASSASVRVTITPTDQPGGDVLTTLEDVVFAGAATDGSGGSGLGVAVAAGAALAALGAAAVVLRRRRGPGAGGAPPDGAAQ